MTMKPTLLVIDPALSAPCLEALNCISKIVGELKNSSKFNFTHVEYFSPFLNKIRLENFLKNKKIGAVICLGSFANMTDESPFVHQLAQDAEKYIFQKNIPFFGICFSHQMFANIHGFHVNYLKERHLVPGRKYHLFREVRILHPKLALLGTKMESSDYFSENQLDLNFKELISLTQNWKKKQWDILSTERKRTLTPFENRLKEHIKNHTSKSIVSHARHEQEVWGTKKEASLEVALAATSSLCTYEALVHCQKPIFSIQTHPETHHATGGGYLLIKNFIYMASIIYTEFNSLLAKEEF